MLVRAAPRSLRSNSPPESRRSRFRRRRGSVVDGRSERRVANAIETATVACAHGHIAVKLVALLPVPAGVITLILPVVAPAGTVAVIRIAELTV